MTDAGAQYVLDLSRIFDAPPSRIYQAFTRPDVLARWITTPAPHLDSPLAGDRNDMTGDQAAEADEAGDNLLLSWHEEPSAAGGGRETRIELHAEPGGRTELDLREGPYSEAEETDARARWNSAFSHLDSVLED
jgi:uncharacterized protein YndB with AHSA1/START domain